MRFLLKMMMKLTILPFARILTNQELLGKFNSFNFSITKTKKISEYSANYFISAVKQ